MRQRIITLCVYVRECKGSGAKQKAFVDSEIHLQHKEHKGIFGKL